jgi:Outer membrane protein beta-barrel domain
VEKLITNLIYISLSLLFIANIYAQEDIDVVYLKNGTIIKGKIIEQVPNQSYKIKTRNGSIFVCKIEEIEKITVEEVAEDNNGVQNSQVSGFFGMLSGGLSVPYSHSGDDWYKSYNFGISAGYIFHKNFGARLDFAYNSFDLEGPHYIPMPAIYPPPYEPMHGRGYGERFSLFSLRGDFLVGNFERTSKFAPYGFLGLGMFFNNNYHTIEDGNFMIANSNYTMENPYDNHDHSETQFAIAVGGGVSFKTGKHLSIFGELQYNHGFGHAPVTSFMPIKAGIVFHP